MFPAKASAIIRNPNPPPIGLRVCLCLHLIRRSCLNADASCPDSGLWTLDSLLAVEGNSGLVTDGADRALRVTAGRPTERLHELLDTANLPPKNQNRAKILVVIASDVWGRGTVTNTSIELDRKLPTTSPLITHAKPHPFISACA